MEQFQLEAVVRNRRTLANTLTPHTQSNDTLEPRLLELLFGLTTRDWLCDSEKALLDSLIDEDEVTFLLRDGVCLHPEGAPILPIDQIESAHRCSGEGVFAQRHVIEADQTRKTCKVRSARLCDASGHELIFGSLGRDGRDDHRQIDTRFAFVVSCFRKAQESLPSLLHGVNSASGAEQPALFVNRCSGRIIGMNALALEQLALDEKGVVGVEFGQVRESLSAALEHGSLKFTNLRKGGLDLGVISLMSGSDSHKSIVSTEPGIGFVNQIRNKVSSISAAARHLDSIFSNDPGNTVTELVRIILEESADLDRHAWRQQLVAQYPDLPKVSASPVSELKAAMDLVGSSRTQCRITLLEDLVDGCRVDCPRSSLLLLFEAALRAHLALNHDQIESRITVRCHKPEEKVSVMVQTENHDRLAELRFEPDWLLYADRLAGVMEIAINHSVKTADNSLQTLITLK